MQNGEVSLNNGSLSGGANAANFSFVKANGNAKSVFDKFKLGQAGDRDSFVKNLNDARDSMKA